LRFSGFLAWVFWLIAHIFFLIGFRNRAGATWYTGDGCRDQAG
jgi:NADH dehydrogenase FAD-containing subunit